MSKDYSSFEELIAGASKYLEDIKRSKSTVSMYNWIWKRIKLYMDKNGIDKLDSTVVHDYLKFTFGEKSISQLTHHQKHWLRCSLCLVQFSETDKMIEIMRVREPLIFNGEIGLTIMQYIEYKKEMRLAKRTLSNFTWYLNQFLQFLNEHQIFTFDSLSPLVIMKYASSLLPEFAGAKHLSLSLIKNYLRYLYDLQKTKTDLSLIVPRDNYKKQPKLPSTYTGDEVATILESVDRSSAIGKRDYAILVLAVRLGMRASDISKLEFSNILWSSNIISFNQYKTGNVVELPLSSDIGESIIDYIKYARPFSESKTVFLEHTRLKLPISSNAVSSIANRTIQKSGVKIGDRKHGSHALRHTMAGLLLENKTPLPIISELLGHTSIQSSMNYLRIDVESMRQCALDVPVVPESFYKQKGGAFYE